MVEETKFKIGSEWKRRDGLKATVLDNNFKLTNTDIGLCVKIKSPGINFEDIDMLFANGKAFNTQDSTRDLIEPWHESVKVDGWVIVHDNNQIVMSKIYSNKDKAQLDYDILINDHKKGIFTSKPIAIVHVTGEEGKE